MILTFGTTPAVARSMEFDRLTLDAVNRAAAVHVSAAGKSINAARVLTTLGRDCVCAGIVGGQTGQLLRDALDAEQIRHAFIDGKSATRVCVTVIDRSTSTATELVEEASRLSEQEADDLLRRLTELAPRCTTLLCCGGLAPGLPVDFYGQAIRTIRRIAPHARIIVDTSGPALAATLGEGVIVKCNRRELGACLDRPLDADADLREALAQLSARGIVGAVVSDGAKPTWVSAEGTLWQIDTPDVPVISPIGSGDAMAAGLAAGLETGAHFVDAARLAVACGAANAQTAVAGSVDPAEVDRLLNRLTPRSMD